MKNVSKEQFTTGVFWKLCEQFGPSLVTFVLAIVLARLLSAEDYGIIAIATLFVAFCDILVQNGFCTSLVQNKNTKPNDYSVAMTLSLLIAVVLYIAIFFCAPLIAKYYKMESLTNILRILGILVFLNGISAVINAYITVTFRFKLLFIVHMISSVFSGVIGVFLAYKGFGAWALVAQKLIQQAVFILILAIILKWNFKPSFNKESAKTMLSYGTKILGGALVAFISDNTYSVVIGKKYSGADLGYLNKADQLPNAVVLVASNSLASIMLPTIATIQDDKVAVKNALRRVMCIVSYVIFPIVVGLFVVSDTLIEALFTRTFIGSVPLLRAVCLFYITVPMLLSCGSVLKALGKSRLYMWMEIIKMLLTVITVFLLTTVITIGLQWLVLVKGIISVGMCLFTLFFTKKYINYGLVNHIKDILPAVLLSASMGLAVWGITFVLNGLPIFLILIIQILCGISFYVLVSILFRVKSFAIVVDIFKSLLNKLFGVVRSVFKREKSRVSEENDIIKNDSNQATEDTTITCETKNESAENLLETTKEDDLNG